MINTKHNKMHIHLIQYGGAIHVPPTYNTTNTINTLIFDQFMYTHNYHFFCIESIQIFNLFQLQYMFLYKFLPYFIIKNYYKLHIIFAYIYYNMVYTLVQLVILHHIYLYTIMYEHVQTCTVVQIHLND